MTRLLGTLALTFTLAAPALAADWPAWRGPTGQGHSDEKNLPLTWSPTENVKWKVPLADPGNSTPIVFGDKIFLTQANKGGTVRSLICFARADGKILWQTDVKYDVKETAYNPNWYANASPTTDGERVVVSFGSAGLYCYDLAGKELWKRTDLGKWEHTFGNGASPVLYADTVIQWCGPNEKGRNYLLAVDKKTGASVWETDESFGSWSTPVIAKVKDVDQIILGQSRDAKNAPEPKTGFLKGYDAKTGKELWKCQGMNSFVYTSALYANGVAVGMSGYGVSALAVDLNGPAGGSGDVTKDRLWLHPKPAGQRVGSGVIVGDHVYMVDENGTVHCYELKTGVDLWKDEPKLKGGTTWGSIVHADGRLYLLLRNGSTVVLNANPKHEVLATNALGGGEQTNSSIAVSNGDLFVRTFKSLWCIRGAQK
jgi:outer membrane protein assembly factor BamB